jgi:hypothetical protein
MLAFVAVFVTVALTSTLLADGLKPIVNSLLKITVLDLKPLFAIIVFVDIIVLVYELAKGSIDLLNALTANINVSNEKGIITDSKLFFSSISLNTFTDYKNQLSNMSEKELIDDIDSQTYINAKICTNKFINYNKAIKCIKISIISFIVLIILLFAFSVLFK